MRAVAHLAWTFAVAFVAYAFGHSIGEEDGRASGDAWASVVSSTYQGMLDRLNESCSRQQEDLIEEIVELQSGMQCVDDSISDEEIAAVIEAFMNQDITNSAADNLESYFDPGAEE